MKTEERKAPRLQCETSPNNSPRPASEEKRCRSRCKSFVFYSFYTLLLFVSGVIVAHYVAVCVDMRKETCAAAAFAQSQRGRVEEPTHYSEFTDEGLEFAKEYPKYGYRTDRGPITPENNKVSVYDLRQSEFQYVPANETYLDFTGAGMYQSKQVSNALNELQHNLYCNTHSENSPCSLRTDRAIENVRREVLSYFNTDQSKYTVIFTQSATAALKMVGDAFPWENGSEYVYAKHNHNSVLGIRRLAMANGGNFFVLPFNFHKEWEKMVESNEELRQNRSASARRRNAREADVIHSLVAFPAECNFSGVKYPLELVNQFENNNLGDYVVEMIKQEKTNHNNDPVAEFQEMQTACKGGLDNQTIEPEQKIEPETQQQSDEPDAMADEKSKNKVVKKWHVLLDAAAYVPTNRLDLSKVQPSFVTMSFYKMFGFPTGIGALLVRNDVAPLMRKQFFSGGTVVMASCDTDYCKLKAKYNERFEDGTLSFLDINFLKYGFEALNEIGIDNINAHVWAVTRYMVQKLSQIKHSNGLPVVKIYGEHETNDPKLQGGIVAFNLFDRRDKYIGYNVVTETAKNAGVLIRAGCVCNPGACYNYLDIDDNELKKVSEARTSCGDEIDELNSKPLGAIRASVGYPTTVEDVDKLVALINKFVDYENGMQDMMKWL